MYSFSTLLYQRICAGRLELFKPYRLRIQNEWWDGLYITRMNGDEIEIRYADYHDPLNNATGTVIMSYVDVLRIIII